MNAPGRLSPFLNGTRKPSPELSHTGGLIDRSAAIMREHGASVDVIRAVDHDIATGVYPDMTEHGAATDEWPQLYERVLAADILVMLVRSGWVTTARSPSALSSGCTATRRC